VIRRGLVIAISTLCILIPGVGSGARVQAQTQAPLVIAYGDSLTWEAQAGLATAIETAVPGARVIAHTTPGMPVCDAIPWMRDDAGLNPSVVVMEFVAVPFSGCMKGRDQVQAHADDLDEAIRFWSARGVPVVVVDAPRAQGEPSDPTPITTVNRDVAARTRQRSVDSGLLLRDPWTGIFQQRLPCLAGEATKGCGADGTIDVRVPEGGHFCAVPNVGPCPVYSSGIVRFSAPIADAVAQTLGRAPVAFPAPATVPGVDDALRSWFGAGSPTAGTVADRSTAASAALTDAEAPGDFGAQTSAPVASSLDQSDCRATRRGAASMSRAAAGGSTFAAPDGSGTLDDVVRVFRSERAARAAHRAYSGNAAAACLRARLEASVRNAVGDPAAPVTVDVRDRSFTAGDDSSGYDVTVSATGPDGPATRSATIETVRVGRSVVGVVATNAGGPPSSEVVRAVTDLVAGRAGPTVG
jgi:hypothetical protein